MPPESDRIRRFSRAQRVAHWAFALAFFAGAATGLILVLPGAGGLAAGGASRVIHRVAAVLLLLAPAYYLVFDRKGLARLVRESFTYDRDDLAWLRSIPRYALGRTQGLPPQGRLNAGQKVHHALVIILYLTLALSGLGLWAGKEALGATALTWTLVMHNVSAFGLLLLTVGHLYFTFVYGALGRMTTGLIHRAAARREHTKWVAELEATERGSK